MQHKIYKNRIEVTEGQPGKKYALMVAPWTALPATGRQGNVLITVCLSFFMIMNKIL